MGQIDGGWMVAKALKTEGVSCVFTLCGGHIAPIYEGCLKEGIDIIDTRHEQAAGHAADGWARLTRGVGVAIVTAGPGVSDVVTAVANAYYAQVPLVETLHKAEKCAIMAGSQIWWDDAAAELVACAEALELPVYTNAMGRGSISPAHRLAFQLSRRQALSQADWVLVVGTLFDFRLNYGQSPTFGAHTKVIQVDRDSHILGKNRSCEIGIHADAKAVLAEMALKARAVGKPNRSAWVTMLRDAETKAQERQREKEKNDAVPISHYRFAREIADFIKDDPNTLLIGDGGDIVVASAKVLPQKKPGGWHG